MKVLIVDNVHESVIEMLRSADVEVDYQPDIDRKNIKSRLSSYDVMVIRSKTRVDAELLQNKGKLKLVVRAGSGIENMDKAAFKAAGVDLQNTPEGNMDAVAEHSMGMILSLLHHIHRAHWQIRSLQFLREENRGVELMNKTVGIIGYGWMGRALARRLKSFGCRVLAYDKYLSNYGDDYAQESSLEKIQSEADILSIHLPLTTETEKMVDDSFIVGFAKPFYLINTSRGEIVNTEHLIEALENGKIKGAALDVFENERFDNLNSTEKKQIEHLSHHENVILTPHIAGWTHESNEKINVAVVQRIKDYFSIAK
ncbi:MAG: phosphoglycerate dehydrogenase [Cyclobacteriaceae bacterium]|nr:phosphoglycerate dehydrogenase [Cyclobacteriaceae bacterium]